jgi:hypothetical protein
MEHVLCVSFAFEGEIPFSQLTVVVHTQASISINVQKKAKERTKLRESYLWYLHKVDKLKQSNDTSPNAREILQRVSWIFKFFYCLLFPIG